MQVGGGKPAPHAVSGVLGPGTGLGVSGVIPTVDGFVTLGSEGGHVNFAPGRRARVRDPAVRLARMAARVERAPDLRPRHGNHLPRAGRAQRRGGARRARSAEIIAGALERARPAVPGSAGMLLRHAGRRRGQPGGDAGRVRRHLHRRRHRAAPGRVVQDLAVPRPLRSQGPLLRLPGADPDLRHHDAEPGASTASRASCPNTCAAAAAPTR